MSRRRLEIALGVLWLLDGALQFQPFMFTKVFFAGILGMANMGLPGPLSQADYWVATVLVHHPIFWNSVFASLQVMLGIGLIWRRTARVALVTSVPWALGVWVIGEGVGGMFMGGTSLLDGAPGAALLYALVAVLLLTETSWRHLIGVPIWALVWCGSALLEFETVNHAAGVPAAQIANGGYGEPGWLAALNRAGGHLFANRGAELALVLGIVGTFVGLGVLWTTSRRAALAGGMAVAVVVGLLGQDLGAIATGHGTDPGTGPLLILLAIALWPKRAARATTAEVTIGQNLVETPIPNVGRFVATGNIH